MRFTYRRPADEKYRLQDQLRDFHFCREDAFDKLLDAVGDFIDDNHGGTKSDFYTAVENVRVDNADNYTDKPETDKGKEVDFKAPKTPIIIKEVKIDKY